jgi:hypothetical protein
VGGEPGQPDAEVPEGEELEPEQADPKLLDGADDEEIVTAEDGVDAGPTM